MVLSTQGQADVNLHRLTVVVFEERVVTHDAAAPDHAVQHVQQQALVDGARHEVRWVQPLSDEGFITTRKLSMH